MTNPKFGTSGILFPPIALGAQAAKGCSGCRLFGLLGPAEPHHAALDLDSRSGSGYPDAVNRAEVEFFNILRGRNLTSVPA